MLDEARSALDNITGGAILDAIRQLAHRKTIAIDAHRLTTMQECDTIRLLESSFLTAAAPGNPI